MKTSKIAILVLILFMGSGLFAQKATPFESKTGDVAKIKAKMDFPTEGRTSKNGSGYSTNVDLLDPKPKKIALVSFYLYDPACGKGKGGTMAGHASVSAWRTPEDLAQQHIDGFYTASIEALKAEFKAFGMDLLTPAEFVDTDEKAEFYYGFNQETAKKEKTERRLARNAGTDVSTVAEVTISTIKISPTGEGYRAFFVVNEPLNESPSTHFINTGIGSSNRKMTSSLGYELCQGLGVDAVVVCYIVTRKPNKKKEDYAVDAVNLFMFGPNPKASGPDDKNRGQFYCGTRYLAGGLLFQSEKDGSSFKNMDNVLTSLSRRMGNWVMHRKK